MRKNVVSIAEGTWKNGAFVPTSGIYSVQHREHRLPAEVTLLQGEVFPRCEACESEVVFRLRRKLPGLASASGFRVQLYQLPVLDEQQNRAS